jgi:hypothetical protein
LYRLPGLQREVANDAVALVEQAQNRDAVGHRSDAGLRSRAGTAAPGARCIRLPLSLVLLAAAPRQKQHQRRAGNGENAHAQSGVQGW